MISILEYLNTKVKVKSNKVIFYDVIDTLIHIAKEDDQLLDIVNTVEQYYNDSIHAKKILDYLANLVENGYEPVIQTDYKTYFRLNGQQMEFNENSKIITFSFYKPNSFQNAKNLSIDIYDFENLTWQLIIMSISENKCILDELNGDSFERLENDIKDGALYFDVIIHDKLNNESVEKICKYLTEKLS